MTLTARSSLKGFNLQSMKLENCALWKFQKHLKTYFVFSSHLVKWLLEDKPPTESNVHFWKWFHEYFSLNNWTFCRDPCRNIGAKSPREFHEHDLSVDFSDIFIFNFYSNGPCLVPLRYTCIRSSMPASAFAYFHPG